MTQSWSSVIVTDEKKVWEEVIQNQEELSPGLQLCVTDVNVT